MADPKVVYTLARCVEAGFAEAMNQGAMRFDPFVRGGIKKRIRADLADVATKTRVPPEGDGEVHHLRLALLKEVGVAVPNADDVPAVAAATAPVIEANPAKRGKAFWPFVLMVCAFPFLVGGAVLGVMLFPTQEERFRASPFGVALGDPMTQFVRDAEKGLGKKHKDEILGTAVKVQIGEPAAKQLEQLFDAVVEADSALDEPAKVAAEKIVKSSAADLNKSLATKRIPAFLEPEPGFTDAGRITRIFTYYVADRGTIKYGSEPPIEIVWGRRLDHLTLYSIRLVARTTDDVALLSLDELEHYILQDVAAMLAKGKPVEMGLSNKEDPASLALQKLIRDELLKAADLSDVEADDMAQLLDKRRNAYERLKAKDIVPPRGLMLAAREQRKIRGDTDDIDAKEAIAINDKLAGYSRQFSRLENAIAALEEEEEISFGAKKEGEDLKVSGRDVTSYVDARLGTLSRSRTLPWSALLMLIRDLHASTGAATAFDALLEELGIKASWHAKNGRIDDGILADAISDLVKRPQPEIKSGATKAYEKLLHRSPPAYERVKK